MIKIKKGLNLPITGAPEQKIEDAREVTKVALLGDDYVGMKPTMLVKVGDQVKKGQALFSDKKTEGVVYTSPASGEVMAINRGEKRVLQSVVVAVKGDEQVSFQSYEKKELNSWTREGIESLLIESGLWTSLRRRPFSKVAEPGTTPHSIFITLTDSNPLAADPALVLEGEEEAFKAGVEIVSRLSGGKTFLCTPHGMNLELEENQNVVTSEFSGPHPSGNVGTHIHFLDPVSANKMVWHLGLQDTIAIGKLFLSGELETRRIISIAGPLVRNPRLLKTRLGACLSEVLEGEYYPDGGARVISGSVFSGRKANEEAFSFLGKYHQQVTVLKEGNHREFLGWHSPGLDKFSVKPIYLSRLLTPKRKFPFTTDRNGSVRSIVPIGSYESVMPMDILPTQLLRALMSRNTVYAQKLGCLELDEEDLALCTFVDPCKNEFGPVLRENLTMIEKDG